MVWANVMAADCDWSAGWTASTSDSSRAFRFSGRSSPRSVAAP